MKNIKRVTASMLTASILFGVCSCSASIEDPVKDAADSLAKSITDRDYQEILEQVTVGAMELEKKMTFSSDDSMQDLAREKIADTMSYEVDESSYSGDKDSGSIDVEFSYADYSSLSDEFFPDMEAFSSALSDCSDRVEVTVTFDFVKKDDQILCDNIHEAQVLFPYADAEFNFALPLSEYVDSVAFTGASWSVGEYTYLSAPENVAGTLYVGGDGQLLTWEYYWEIAGEEGVIGSSAGTITDSCPTEIGFEYPYSSDLFPNGEYTVTFYTADGEVIKEVPFRFEIVEHVAGSSSGTYLDPGNSFADGFVCPSDGIITLPDTDVVISLPGDLFCMTPEDVQGVMDGISMFEKPILFFASNAYGDTVVYCEELNLGGYDSAEADAYFRSDLATIEDGYTSFGYEVSVEYSEYTTGDRTFTVASMSADLGFGTWYGTYILLGDEDQSYRITISTLDSGFADGFLNCISLA